MPFFSAAKRWPLPVQASNHPSLPTLNTQAESAEEKPSPASLPQSVTDAIFQDIQTRWAIDPARAQITQAEPRLWSDGCLGLAPPGEFCQEVLVAGWQVTVAHSRQQWVYRIEQFRETSALGPGRK